MLLSCTLAGALQPTTVALNNGVAMPRINLGTCYGSQPAVGLPSWFDDGGVGIDTGWDCFQAQVKSVIGGKNRDSFFITTRILCQGDKDQNSSLSNLKQSMEQLGVDRVDLVLLPLCEKLLDENWQGLEDAVKQNLTRAIGVVNFNSTQLGSLAGTVPAVNQCELSINGSWGQSGHDDQTIAYCQQKGIVYESYGALKGCPFSNKKTMDIATRHNKSVAQVCLRWVLDRGASIASGTGSDHATAPKFARENLDIFDFELTKGEVAYLNGLSP